MERSITDKETKVNADDLKIAEGADDNQGRPDEDRIFRDPFAKYADSQYSFQLFAREMLEKLGGEPKISVKEIQTRIGRAMKEENELSKTVIAMREE